MNRIFSFQLNSESRLTHNQMLKNKYNTYLKLYIYLLRFTISFLWLIITMYIICYSYRITILLHNDVCHQFKLQSTSVKCRTCSNNFILDALVIKIGNVQWYGRKSNRKSQLEKFTINHLKKFSWINEAQRREKMRKNWDVIWFTVYNV